MKEHGNLLEGILIIAGLIFSAGFFSASALAWGSGYGS